MNARCSRCWSHQIQAAWIDVATLSPRGRHLHLTSEKLLGRSGLCLRADRGEHLGMSSWALSLSLTWAPVQWGGGLQHLWAAVQGSWSVHWAGRVLGALAQA